MKIKLAVYLADQNPHRDKSLGVTKITETLLMGLSKYNDIDITIFISKSSFRFVSDNIKTIRYPWRTDNLPLRLITDHLHPVGYSFMPKFDIYYYPKGWLPIFTNHNANIVTTIHDTIIQYYADHFPEEHTKSYYTYWINNLKNSSSFLEVITASRMVIFFNFLKFLSKKDIL